MSKPSKNKKDRVPKISEAEYVAYISALKTMGEESSQQAIKLTKMENQQR